MPVPDSPVAQPPVAPSAPERRGWTTADTSLLLGALAVALLPVTYRAIGRAAVQAFAEVFALGIGDPRWIAVGLLAVVVTAGCGAGAIVVGGVALLTRRSRVKASIGVALGLVPFLCLAALVIANR